MNCSDHESDVRSEAVQEKLCFFCRLCHLYGFAVFCCVQAFPEIIVLGFKQVPNRIMFLCVIRDLLLGLDRKNVYCSCLPLLTDQPFPFLQHHSVQRPKRV